MTPLATVRVEQGRSAATWPMWPTLIGDSLTGHRPATRFIAAEPAVCPTLTNGVCTYDFGDALGMGPVVEMFTLGHRFVPERMHSGGLHYHGNAPSLCMLVDHGVVEARAYKQSECFAEAVRFARSEGFIPAPESAHAIRAGAETDAAREAGDAS